MEYKTLGVVPMFKFCYFVMIISILSSSMLLANDEKSIEQKLLSLKLERLQAELMIKTMSRSGRMNKKEVAYATRSIASIKEKDVKNIRAEALETLGTATSLATK